MQKNNIYPIMRPVLGIFLMGLVSISIVVNAQPLNISKSSIKELAAAKGNSCGDSDGIDITSKPSMVLTLAAEDAAIYLGEQQEKYRVIHFMSRHTARGYRSNLACEGYLRLVVGENELASNIFEAIKEV